MMSLSRGAFLVLAGISVLILGVLGASAFFHFQSWSHTQTGLASWYGRGEDGQKTASGVKFHAHDFVAAHRTLPFNTLVRVTNQRNGHSADVRIIDRGPYVKGRILDVSEAVADRLDMKRDGVVPVKIEILDAQGNVEK